MKVYVLAAIAFFLSALLSTAGYQTYLGCFFIPGFAFAIPFMIFTFTKVEHKTSFFLVSGLAYFTATMAPSLTHIAPDFFSFMDRAKHDDVATQRLFYLDGAVGGLIISIYLYKIGINLMYAISIFCLSVALSAFFVNSGYPLLSSNTVFEMCYPWVTWQVGVGLAIVYAYRNTFSKLILQ